MAPLGRGERKLLQSLLMLLLLLGTVASAANSGKKLANSTINTRIVGGTSTNIKKFKFLVNLRISGSFTCGGSLVTPRFVVTAAHCVKGVNLSKLTVHAGASLLSSKGRWRKVTKVILPKAFTYKSLVQDVAVLKLGEPLTGKMITTIPLCSRTIPKGASVQIAGWGVTKETNKNVPKRVRKAKLKMFGKSACQKKYNGVTKLTKSMVCAGVLGKKSACYGDSGGPLVYKGQLCGIVSWGMGCDSTQYPGVFTSVRVMKTFIKRALKS